MRRSSLRFAAVGILSVTLAACSSLGLGGEDRKASDAKAAPDSATDISALKDHPANLRDEIHRAQTLRAQGDYADAIHVLSQLMLIAPDDPGVVAEYGKVLVQQNRPDEAVDFLKRAVELQPGDWTLYSALGVAYDQMGDPQSAKFAYDGALALAPGEPSVLNNYAMSRAAAGDIVTAKRLIAQAAAKNAADPRIAKNVALIANYTPTPRATALVQPLPSTVAGAHAPAAKPGAPHFLAAGNVVMQNVPTDALAGPVAKAKAASHRAAAERAAEATAIAKKKTPELRASADAS